MYLRLIPFLFFLAIPYLSKSQTIENIKTSISGETVTVSFDLKPKYDSRGEMEIYTPILEFRTMRVDGVNDFGEKKEINLPGIQVKSGPNKIELDAYTYFSDYIENKIRFETTLKLNPIFIPTYFSIGNKKKFRNHKNPEIETFNEWDGIDIKYSYIIKSDDGKQFNGDVSRNSDNKRILEIKDQNIPKGEYTLEILSNGYGNNSYKIPNIEITKSFYKTKKGKVDLGWVFFGMGVAAIVLDFIFDYGLLEELGLRDKKGNSILPDPPDPNG